MTDAGFSSSDRFVSLLAMLAVAFLGASGVVMLYGSWMPWLFDLHRIMGFVFFILLPFKTCSVYRDIKHQDSRSLKHRVERVNMTVLAVLIILIIVPGLMWMWRLGPYSTLKQTLITWHWIFGVASLPFFALHAMLQPPRLHANDVLLRRSLLNLAGLTGLSLLFSRSASWLAEAQASQAFPRRFTGSRGFGLFSGNDYPTTGEPDVVIDKEQYRLVIGGAVGQPLVLTYSDLLALPSTLRTESIDCHNGWYSQQDWKGVSLASLLDKAMLSPDASGVRISSASGLSNTYLLTEALEIILATHSSGEVLDVAHGFPVRLIVPGRRGWFWLKWVVRVEVLLSPLEVAGGILCTPLQVFRELPGPRVSTDVR